MRASSRAVLGAMLCAALCALAPLARAGGEKTVDVAGVHVAVGSAWPSSLAHGWQPLRVRIENLSGEARRVQLEFACRNGPESDEIAHTLQLAAGATARFEVAAPVRGMFQNSYDVLVSAGGERSWISDVGAEQSGDVGLRRVLLVARDPTLPADAAAWTTSLSDEARPRYESAGGSGPRVVIGHMGPGPGATTEAVVVTPAAHADLSTLPEAYTSLDALVLETRGGIPADDALAPILAWARSGGVLAVWGPGARETVQRAEALAAWAEPRFLVRRTDAGEVYALGRGLLVVTEGAASPPDAGGAALLNAMLETTFPWGSSDPYAGAGAPKLGGIEVPYRPLALLLVVFALIVGPLNMILVRRAKKPVLLLVTIPAISLVFSAGLVAYGIVAQGLDVRAASRSRAVLDQRSHQAACLEQRTTFAGLTTGPGLRPGAGTMVLRPVREGYDWSNQRDHRVELDDGVLLADGWLPVRTPTPLWFALDRPARGRVELARDGDGWSASNALEAEIEELLFRDADGALHRFRGPILPGRTARAEAESPAEAQLAPWSSLIPLGARPGDGLLLPRGCWLARLAGGRSPFTDACGIDYQELAGDHVVLGVLALEDAR